MSVTRWQTKSVQDPRPGPLYWLHGPQSLPLNLTDTWEWAMSLEELRAELRSASEADAEQDQQRQQDVEAEKHDDCG